MLPPSPLCPPQAIADAEADVARIWRSSFQTELTASLEATLREQALAGVRITRYVKNVRGELARLAKAVCSRNYGKVEPDDVHKNLNMRTENRIRQYFTRAEAEAKVDRQIQTCVEFPGVPTVIPAVAQPYIHIQTGKPLIDWFTKDEYERYLALHQLSCFI